MLVLGLAANAYGEEPDYEGTYVGMVTTNTGRKVPIIVYARGQGDQAVLTLGVEGYTVRVADAALHLGHRLSEDLDLFSECSWFWTQSAPALSACGAPIVDLQEEVRRDVVGQMLDYAANGLRYWPIS